MHLVLSLAGIAAIAGGVLMLGMGWREGGMRIGDGVVLTAVIAACSGFLLLGLASGLTRLRRIAEALEAQPFPRMAAPNAPGAKIGVAAPAPAIATTPKPAEAPPLLTATPADAAEPRRASAANLAAVSAALDFGAATSPSSSDASAAPPVVIDKPSDQPAASAPEVSITSPAEGPPEPPRVLKSGVIEGMAYTLYSDGSVDAEMPTGTMHFASIADWRAHIRVGA